MALLDCETDDDFQNDSWKRVEQCTCELFS